MPNEAQFTVAGFVATSPSFSATKSGLPTMTMRVAWTPRRVDRSTGEWTDEPTCFVSVKCYGRTAENCKISLEKGDPVVVTGTLRMHDYESKEGAMRTSVDITASAIGHDLARGTSVFNRRGRKAQPAAGEGQAD
jgi:single-strand DNA-binding protein